jgi:serine/threonine protein kinase
MAPPIPTEDFFGLVGYQLDGKYNIEAVVARGGYGVVYRARHAVLQTPFAVKVLRIPDDISQPTRTRFLDQFVEEARIVAQLQHPAIVRVTDFGVSMMHDNSQAPWMVLEWIEGQTLAANLLARRGAGGRSPRDCLTLLRPVIDALASAHEAGIAHRDIKPGNVMLPVERVTSKLRGATRTGQQTPISRVLDFGIAKIMNEGDDGPATGLTKTHSVTPAFSPRYASPEQVSGTRTGPWTDVHALGLILTEMLTDLSAYPTADKMELHVRVMSPVRPTPLHFGVDVGAWEPVLARAMALRPSDRFANAGELLVALEAAVPDVVIAVPEPARTAEPAIVDPTPRNPIPTVVAHLDTGPTLTPTERIAPGRRGGVHRAFLGVAAAVAIGVCTFSLAMAVRRARVAVPAAHVAATPHEVGVARAEAQPVVDAGAHEPVAAAPASPTVDAAPVVAASPVVQQVIAPAPSEDPPAAPHGHSSRRARGHHHGDSHDASGRVRPE